MAPIRRYRRRSGWLNIDLGPIMNMQSPKGSGRIRARRAGHGAASAEGCVFRIEDEAGVVLHRIRGARTSEQAIALYWRDRGTALAKLGLRPGVAMSKDLDRRISQARADAARAAMRTAELPFEPVPSDPGSEPVRVPRRGRTARGTGLAPQSELFEDPALREPASEPEPKLVPAVEAEPHLLDPHTIMLQRADPRNLRPTDCPDSYLYHVTNGTDAETALRNGLLVSASDPVILTERQGVAYWLSVLAEDYDYILDGPADFVVLRLRRMTVEELLEHDTHASRSAGCSCYLLTGGGTPPGTRA